MVGWERGLNTKKHGEKHGGKNTGEKHGGGEIGLVAGLYGNFLFVQRSDYSCVVPPVGKRTSLQPGGL